MGRLSLTANFWNLKDRNGNRASLRGRPLGPEVAVADLTSFPPMYFGGFEKEVEKRFPGTAQACYVQLWLPGYSLSGTIALVEFGFGPTSHGASVLLAEKAGRRLGRKRLRPLVLHVGSRQRPPANTPRKPCSAGASKPSSANRSPKSSSATARPSASPASTPQSPTSKPSAKPSWPTRNLK